MSTAEENLAAAAAKSQSTTADGVSVSRHSLRDQMAYADREAAKAATANVKALFRGMNHKIVPPGGVR